MDRYSALSRVTPLTLTHKSSVLIGVGLLSLPMGLRYSGWICGMVTLAACATMTAYTAKLLARCQDLDQSLITFSDLAFISFGSRARLATSFIFMLELVAANVALVVLFADSLVLLFPHWLSVTEWKVVCTILLIPLQFLPLSLLSYTSVIGIVSCFSSKCSDARNSLPDHGEGGQVHLSQESSRLRVRGPPDRCGGEMQKADICPPSPVDHSGRRPHQDYIAGLSHPACRDVPISCQLAYASPVVWTAHVALGWPQRLS